MYTKVKTTDEIRNMRESGHMLATVLRLLKPHVVPGRSTKELADYAAKELRGMGGKPAFMGYQGFPDVICISVNDEVVHGIPRTDKIIESGDIIGLDFGVNYNGMITDAAISVIAGRPKNANDSRLVLMTEESLSAGINVVKDGVKTGDIGHAIQKVLDKAKLGIVRDLVGHGVGHYVHEDPNIANYGKKGQGPALQTGMTVAIEPMATLGGYGVMIDPDGWTIRTADGSRAAHFEHTVLITESGAEILTKL